MGSVNCLRAEEMKLNRQNIGYAVIILLLIAAGAFSIKLFFQERVAHDKLDIHKVPLEIGEWTGREIRLDEYVYKTLETRNMIMREYKNPKGEEVYLFIVYSETNRSCFHPPEVCMVGSGLAIVEKKPEEVSSGKKTFLTNKLRAEKGKYKELILYSYKAGPIYTDNYYLQQTYLIFHQIFGKNVPAATVRVSMPIVDDEKAVLATLKEFLGKTAQIVDGLSEKTS